MDNKLVKSGPSAIANLEKVAKLTANMSAVQESLIIILDASGSMASNESSLATSKTKWDAACHAAKELLTACTPATRVAIIAFSSEIDFKTTFVSPIEAKTSIQSIVPGYGGTFLNKAIQESFVTMHDVNTQIKRMIIMTDGCVCQPDICISLATKCKTSGIIIDTVAFGIDADQELMKRLSGGTGQSVFAKDGVSLAKQFKLLEAHTRGLLTSGKR